ncbi:hypothetical protein NDA14_000338 [Ustilago hordei]|nr:hypothetical protein NDA10_002236 [Ustilago hordei]KAJ1585102.1 hypothetical protein NDA15_002869 [Ustilago hordei]KAJ1588413.1 hypothetical protein NDA12_007187 [Ustilago hordei]KAJ1601226.1 hypothetical protein NDA14_000338 [Ustilago hordei]UTT94361.1 hypothetical protein NDA17_005691 [Ustilago hordei]
MRLDWENPTEPGQQVASTLLDCLTNCTTPAWTDPTVDSDLYILPQVLPVFNLERVFVPMELFNRVLDLIAKSQDTCIGIRNLLFPGSGEDSDDVLEMMEERATTKTAILEARILGKESLIHRPKLVARRDLVLPNTGLEIIEALNLSLHTTHTPQTTQPIDHDNDGDAGTVQEGKTVRSNDG